MNDALAEFERAIDGIAQRRFLARRAQHFGYRQFDVVLDEAFEARKRIGRYPLPSTRNCLSPRGGQRASSR